jgi:uncharacterized protein YgiM (DUF1202 family)
MKKTAILVILINLVFLNYLAGQNKVRTIKENSLVILNDNVKTYQKADDKSKVVSKLNTFDVLMVKSDKIVNDMVEVKLAGNISGWVNTIDTSYIKNLSWKKFDKIENLEMFLPADESFDFIKGETIEDAIGKHTEYKVTNSTYYVIIDYLEGKNEFDILRQSIGEEVQRESFTDFNYYGYEAYYNSGDAVDSGVYYILHLIEKDRSKYYIITVVLDNFRGGDWERTAKRILFSVRLKDSNKSNSPVLNSISNVTMVLTGDNVRVRTEAGTNGAVVATLSKGAKVKLIERTDIALTVGDKTGFWALVETASGIKGYVFDAYLKEEK